MPVEFLSDEQAARYGRYHANPDPELLTRYFYPSPQDLRFVATRRRSYNKLGCAVQLCTLRFPGTFLPDPTQVPAVVVQSLAQQLRLPPEVFEGYRTRPNTWYDHQTHSVAHLGDAPFGAQ